MSVVLAFDEKKLRDVPIDVVVLYCGGPSKTKVSNCCRRLLANDRGHLLVSRNKLRSTAAGRAYDYDRIEIDEDFQQKLLIELKTAAERRMFAALISGVSNIKDVSTMIKLDPQSSKFRAAKKTLINSGLAVETPGRKKLDLTLYSGI